MRSLLLPLLFLFAIPLGELFSKDTAEQTQAIEKLMSLGAEVERAGGDPEGDIELISLIGSETLTDDDLKYLKLFPSLTQLFLGRTAISDAGLNHLAGLKNLKEIGLIGTKVTDAGMKHLAKLEKLEGLRIGDNQIGDAGLMEVGKLPNLAFLILAQTGVTDDGLKHLENSQNLTVLNLQMTNVTDAGLKHLAGLKKLSNLMVGQTKVTDAGIQQLKKSLPQLQTAQRPSGGGQREDPDFDVSVSQPAYKDKHPAVLFDEAHRNFHTSTGRYKVFADLITNDGYRVSPGQQPFTPEQLARYEILVIANPLPASGASKSAFTEQECDCVRDWVKSGGSLLLVTDHEPFGSGSAELGKRFGVEMSLRVGTDPANETGNGLQFSRAKNLIGDHPVMNGRNPSEKVNNVLTFTGQTLKGPAGSTALLKFSDTAVEGNGQSPQVSSAGRAQGVALKFGKGRVVVMGEAGQLSAQVYGEPPQRMGMNVPGCDNRQMVLNIVHWLSGLID